MVPVVLGLSGTARILCVWSSSLQMYRQCETAVVLLTSILPVRQSGTHRHTSGILTLGPRCLDNGNEISNKESTCSSLFHRKGRFGFGGKHRRLRLL